MKKYILILFSIFLLTIKPLLVLADSGTPPPLPGSVSLDVSESKEKEVSYWHKFLNLIGLGNGELEEEKPAKKEVIEEVTNKQKKNIDLQQELAESSEILEIRRPAQAINIFDAEENNDDELKLPEGFEFDEEDLAQEEELGLENIDEEFADNSVPEEKLPILEFSPENADIADKNNDDNKKEKLEFPFAKDVMDQQIESSPESKVAKYRKELQKRLNKANNLPQIPKEEMIKNNDDELIPNNIGAMKQNLDSTQLKFVTDEAQVLQLPNDDIVLGEITNEAYLSLIDFSSYVPIFWANYEIVKNEPSRLAINSFIKTYDDDFIKPTKEESYGAFEEAIAAIEQNQIYKLINLLDYYPILQFTDKRGNNLLHISAMYDNYLAAKFVLTRGIYMSKRNDQFLAPIDIARARNNTQIVKLIELAK